MNDDSFDRQRREIEDRCTNALAAADAMYGAGCAQALAEQRQEAAELAGVVTERDRTRAEATAARAAIPASVSWGTATGSLALGLAGCWGIALAIGVCLSRLEGWSSDATWTLGAWVGTIQASLRNLLSPSRFTLWAGFPIAMGLYRLCLGRRPHLPGAALFAIGCVLVGVVHWPVSASKLGVQPLVEGALLAAALTGAGAAVATSVAAPGIRRQWLPWLAVSLVAGFAYLTVGSLGLAACLLAVLGGLCAVRARSGLLHLHLLGVAARCARSYEQLQRRHDRLVGIRVPQPARGAPSWQGPSAGFTQRGEALLHTKLRRLELERQNSRRAAEEEKVASLRELDCQQALHGRYHGN